MQSIHLIVLCALMSTTSALQSLENIQTEKNIPPTPTTSQSNQDSKIAEQSVKDLPRVVTHLELPEFMSVPSKDQSLDLFSYFLRPINFSKEGITHYFKYTYNHDKYTEYLPYNFAHMLQFLEFGQDNNQSEAYAKSIIKLFLQKIKGCDFINAYSLITTMPKLADALTPYMVKKEASFLQELQNNIKTRMSNIFSSYFSYFQKNPDAFLDALSEQIAKKTNDVQTQQHVDIEHIKKDILRFLETCMNKLIWSPEDAYQGWIAINELATLSEQFLDKKLISDIDALDDICWSLIHRFVYYLEISAADIKPEVFVQIVQDIYHEKLLLLEISEQEDLITNKKEYLLKKIKSLCPQALPESKDYKVYASQRILDVAEQKEKI